MKVSIITTNYNTDKYLEQTIRSVLEQKGDFELEYIITDGGSSDNSLDIIKKYDKEVRSGKWGKNVEFKYLSEKDKGQSDGINKGLKIATGDIVSFLNADDLYIEDTLKIVTEYFKAHTDCMWLTGYCRIIDENGKEIRKYITNYKNRKLRNFSLKKLLIENPISQPATFWKRDLHKEFGYIDESLHYAMDQDLWARFASKYKLHLIPKYLAEFRFTSETKTGSSIEKTLKESQYIAKRYTDSKSLLFLQSISNFKRIINYKYFSKIFRN